MLRKYLSHRNLLLHQRAFSTPTKRLFYRGEFTLVDDTNINAATEPLKRLIAEARLLNNNNPNQDNTGIIGVDTETCCSRPTTKGQQHKTSLLQLSTRSNCVMYRLNKLEDQLPSDLLHLLQDSSLLKCGIGLIEDMTTLIYESNQMHEINGCIELESIVNTFPELQRKGINEYNEEYKMKHGLQSLSQLLIKDGYFQKNKQIAVSHWGKKLTPAMLSYAATDAWVGFELGLGVSKKFVKRQKKRNTTKIPRMQLMKPISIRVKNSDQHTWPNRTVVRLNTDGQTTQPKPPNTIKQPTAFDSQQILQSFVQSNTNYLSIPQGLSPKSRYQLHHSANKYSNVTTVSTGRKGKGTSRTMHLFKMSEQDIKRLNIFQTTVTHFMNPNSKSKKNKTTFGGGHMKFISFQNQQDQEQEQEKDPDSPFTFDKNGVTQKIHGSCDQPVRVSIGSDVHETYDFNNTLLIDISLQFGGIANVDLPFIMAKSELSNYLASESKTNRQDRKIRKVNGFISKAIDSYYYSVTRQASCIVIKKHLKPTMEKSKNDLNNMGFGSKWKTDFVQKKERLNKRKLLQKSNKKKGFPVKKKDKKAQDGFFSRWFG